MLGFANSHPSIPSICNLLCIITAMEPQLFFLSVQWMTLKLPKDFKLEIDTDVTIYEVYNIGTIWESNLLQGSY